MDWLIALILGLVGGSGAGYVIVNNIFKKSRQKQIEDSNSKSDLILEQAKIAAKRISDEAEVNAEKILSKAESRNEQIKQKKIQEAKDHFNSKRAEFEKERSSHLVEMKEREMLVVSSENELKRRQNEFKSKTDHIENKESELNILRENLEKQLKIVSKMMEELEMATEEHV